jgi:hypothetical protein
VTVGQGLSLPAFADREVSGRDTSLWTLAHGFVDVTLYNGMVEQSESHPDYEFYDIHKAK